MDRLSAVIEYIQVIASSLDTTTFAGDRPTYERHLAAAARLVPLVAQVDGQQAIDEWLTAEEHGFGWGYLSGEQGELAEGAFATLKTSLSH